MGPMRVSFIKKRFYHILLAQTSLTIPQCLALYLRPCKILDLILRSRPLPPTYVCKSLAEPDRLVFLVHC